MSNNHPCMDAKLVEGGIQLPQAPNPDTGVQVANSFYGWWQSQYHVEKLHEKYLGERLTVAILDTGVNLLPRLADRVIQRKDFTTDQDENDGHSHGTFIACQLAAQHNVIGAKGSIPRSEIISNKVLSKTGFGENPWITAGQENLLDIPMEKGRFYLANLSLGGWYSKDVHEIQKELIAKGWYVFNAAGNFADQGMGYPGANTAGFSIGSINRFKEVSSFSSHALEGQDLDVMDGGEAIISYNKDDQQSTWNGTSMATPNALAKFGLCLEHDYANTKRFYQLADPTEAEKVLENSTEDIETPGVDSTSGHGIFQPELLLEWMDGDTDIPEEVNECKEYYKAKLKTLFTSEKSLKKNYQSTLRNIAQSLDLDISGRKKQLAERIYNYLNS